MVNWLSGTSVDSLNDVLQFESQMSYLTLLYPCHSPPQNRVSDRRPAEGACGDLQLQWVCAGPEGVNEQPVTSIRMEVVDGGKEIEKKNEGKRKRS